VKGHILSVIIPFSLPAQSILLRVSEQPQDLCLASLLTSEEANTFISWMGRLRKSERKTEGRDVCQPVLSLQWLRNLPNRSAKWVLKPSKQRRTKWIFQIPWTLESCANTMWPATFHSLHSSNSI